MKKIYLQARMEYSLWVTNPRMSILLVLFVLIHTLVIQPLAQAGEQIGVSFNILEPLAALCNSSLILLLLPIGFLILIADYPRMGSGFLLQLYRVGRRKWVLGEWVHLVMAAATYLAVVLLGITLLSLPYSPAVGKEWSAVATDYQRILGDDALEIIAFLLPRNLYIQMSPWVAVLRSYLLLLLYLIFIGSVQLATSLLRVKFLGVAINAALLLAGLGLVLLENPLMWGFPCAHALTWIHFTPYYRTPVCPLWTSWLYFIIGSVLMTGAACIVARHRSFDSVLEFD